MSDVSTSSSATPSTSGTSRVTPAPLTPGQTGHQQTSSQGEPQPHATTPAPPPDTAVTLAPTLAGFSEGESVAVAVLGHDAEGRQIVQAPHSVLVTLDAEVLPELATATIRVTGIAHDHLRAQLTSVNGETAPTPHAIRLRVVQVSFPQDPTAPAQSSTPPSTAATPLPPVLQVGAVVQSLNPTSPPATVAGGPAAQPISTPTATGLTSIAVATARPSVFRIVSATPPAGPQAALVVGPPGTTVTSPLNGPTSRTAVPGQGPSAATASKAPASSLGARPLPSAAHVATTAGQPQSAGHRPSGHTPGPAVSNPNIQVSGVITASGRPDQTVITTAAGKIVLAQPAPTHWPTGTTVVLEAPDARPDGQSAPIAATTVAPTNAATRPIDQILMKLGEDWPALRDLAKHTATAAPATAQAFVEGNVPAANARAAAQIMFFLSVLRSGDVTGWLGNDMLRSLERSGQRGLVERLGDDFRQLRRLGDESSANDWRLLLFPFTAGDRIEPIHMFVRGQRRDQADGDQDVRFVVDLKMSTLGALQFDGLLHRQTFDLMVRSHTDLSETQRQDISRIFNTGLESISYRGQIAFQTVKEFPVSPFNDLLGGRHTPGAVLA